MKFHPLADLFPRMTPDEIASLVEDIKSNGLAQPIITFENKILDGRHRYEACRKADVQPVFEPFTGDDPLAFVLSVNLNRRHLSTSQRAMIAAKIEEYSYGGDRKSKNQDANLRLDREKAAETLGVSQRSVCDASKILKTAPALVEKIDAGTMSINAAKAKLPCPPFPAPPPPKSTVVDATGHPVPNQIIPEWKRSQERGQELLTHLGAIRGAVRQAQEAKDPLFKELSYSSVLANLDQAHAELETVKKHAVCPSCQGQLPDNCRQCVGTGLVSKFRWDTTVPREVKELRFKMKKS